MLEPPFLGCSLPPLPFFCACSVFPIHTASAGLDVVGKLLTAARQIVSTPKHDRAPVLERSP